MYIKFTYNAELRSERLNAMLIRHWMGSEKALEFSMGAQIKARLIYVTELSANARWEMLREDANVVTGFLLWWKTINFEFAQTKIQDVEKSASLLMCATYRASRMLHNCAFMSISKRTINKNEKFRVGVVEISFVQFCFADFSSTHLLLLMITRRFEVKRCNLLIKQNDINDYLLLSFQKRLRRLLITSSTVNYKVARKK